MVSKDTTKPTTSLISPNDQGTTSDGSLVHRGSTNNTSFVIDTNQSKWVKIYEKSHKPNFRNFVELDISSTPIILYPGEVKGIYVHSTLPGDQAIVYDNHYGDMNKSDTPEDDFIKIREALAHVSETPFGTVPIWGWGEAWRLNRKFVGSVSYGIVYKLWQPVTFKSYGANFQRLVFLLLNCQRRVESPVSRLPDDCIFYILHLCKWDWMADSYGPMFQSFVYRLMAQEETEAIAAVSASAEAAALTSSPKKDSCSNECESDSSMGVDDTNQDPSSSSDDDEWEEEEQDDDDDDDDDYENFLTHLHNNHRRRSNDTSQSQFTQHTTLFDPMTVQNEYYESYSNMTIDASSSSTAPAASLTTSNNNRNVWLRRFRASNNNTNNSNTRGGVHLFTMMRGGGTVATSTNTSTRRRTLRDNETATES